MDYANENWIKVYTRDTASWLAKSLAARGLALELARHMEKSTGEISLGSRGLRAVAALLRASWEEVESALQELLDEGDLEYDAAEQVLRDPEHPARQGAVASPALRKRQQRERDELSRDVTRGHAESPKKEREKEEKERGDRAGAGAREPEAPSAPPTPPPPSGNMFGIGPDGTPLAGMLVPLKPPDWFHEVVGTVRANTGEDVDVRLAWSRYSAHRAKSGKPMGPMDAQYFVTTVDVLELRRERQLARERIDRRDEGEAREAARARRGMSPPTRKPPPRKAFVDDDAHVHVFVATTRARELAAAGLA